MLSFVRTVGDADSVAALLNDPANRMTVFAFVDSALPSAAVTEEQLSSSPFLPVSAACS